jgi:penicillin amidase
MSTRQRARFDKKRNEELARMEKARAMLVRWDGRMSGASAEAALYGYVWEQLVAEIFRDQYPESEWPMSSGTRAENAVHYLLEEPTNRLWDDVTTPERETRDDILVRSFRRGFEALEKKVGTNQNKWRWDKIHTITFVNPSLGKSGIKPIEGIFNRGPYPLAGGTSEVFAAAWDPKKPFETKHIPSMRFIVDLAAVGSALSVHPPGQSGHPGNRHYADFIELWRKVQYHPALWDKDAVEKHSEGKLVLAPK